jgi:hypothetical protein
MIDIVMSIDRFERLPEQLFVDWISDKVDFGKEPIDKFGSKSVLGEIVHKISNLGSANLQVPCLPFEVVPRMSRKAAGAVLLEDHDSQDLSAQAEWI